VSIITQFLQFVKLFVRKSEQLWSFQQFKCNNNIHLYRGVKVEGIPTFHNKVTLRELEVIFGVNSLGIQDVNLVGGVMPMLPIVGDVACRATGVANENHAHIGNIPIRYYQYLCVCTSRKGSAN